MKTIKLSTASRTLAEYAAEFAGEIVLLTKRNKAPLSAKIAETLSPAAISVEGGEVQGA